MGVFKHRNQHILSTFPCTLGYVTLLPPQSPPHFLKKVPRQECQENTVWAWIVWIFNAGNHSYSPESLSILQGIFLSMIFKFLAERV